MGGRRSSPTWLSRALLQHLGGNLNVPLDYRMNSGGQPMDMSVFYRSQAMWHQFTNPGWMEGLVGPGAIRPIDQFGVYVTAGTVSERAEMHPLAKYAIKWWSVTVERMVLKKDRDSIGWNLMEQVQESWSDPHSSRNPWMELTVCTFNFVSHHCP